jgi:hypothetical protein
MDTSCISSLPPQKPPSSAVCASTTNSAGDASSSLLYTYRSVSAPYFFVYKYGAEFPYSLLSVYEMDEDKEKEEHDENEMQI